MCLQLERRFHDLENVHGAVQTGHRYLGSIVILWFGNGVMMCLEGRSSGAECHREGSFQGPLPAALGARHGNEAAVHTQ